MEKAERARKAAEELLAVKEVELTNVQHRSITGLTAAENVSTESKTDRLKLTSQIATERKENEAFVAQLEDQISQLREKNRRDIATSAKTNEAQQELLRIELSEDWNAKLSKAVAVRVFFLP